MGLVANVCQPSIAHADLTGSEAKPRTKSPRRPLSVLIRRSNSSCSRSMALVMRALLHRLGGSRANVKSRSLASCRLSAIPRCLSRDLRMKALRHSRSS
jgi:hypothetical protein